MAQATTPQHRTRHSVIEGAMLIAKRNSVSSDYYSDRIRTFKKTQDIVKK